MSTPFTITATTNSVHLDKKRSTAASFTVFNASGHPIKGRARLVPENPASESWLEITGKPEREFPIADTDQYEVKINVPPNAAPGRYSFRLDMSGVENPDEDYVKGPSVTFEVPESSNNKKFPWWILAVVAGVLIFAAIAVFFLWPRHAVVPEVTGKTLQEARQIIEKANLALGDPNYEFSDTVEKGLIIRTLPPPSQKLKKGANVLLIISSGPQYILMPQLAGMTEYAAQKRIEEENLMLGDINYEYSNIVTKGLVIKTAPPVGENTKEGSKVMLFVSAGPRMVEVPKEVIGTTKKEAEQIIEEAKLVLGDPEYRYSASVKEGFVISTNPGVGEKVEEGSQVALIISSGPQYVLIPRVAEKTSEKAQEIMEASGLSLDSPGYENSRDIKEGLVIRTVPPAGEKVKEGTKVRLVISSGLKDILVPQVAGKSLREARDMIEKAGLVQADAKYENSRDIKEGLVIRTVPPAGEKVKEGTKVGLIVSSGPRHVIVPRVEGKTLYEARNIIEKASLVPGDSKYENSTSLAQNLVIKTAPPAGEETIEGANVTFIISSGPPQVLAWDFSKDFEGWERTGTVPPWHTIENAISWYAQYGGAGGVIVIDACESPKSNINAKGGIQKRITLPSNATTLTAHLVKAGNDGGIQFSIIDPERNEQILGKEILSGDTRKETPYNIFNWAGKTVTLKFSTYGAGSEKCNNEYIGIDRIEISTKSIISPSIKFPVIKSPGVIMDSPAKDRIILDKGKND